MFWYFKMSSACDEFIDEPERFVIYLLADKRVLKSIVDEKTFIIALEKALASDSSLGNIVSQIKSKGESLSDCFKPVFDTKEVQDIINRNLKDRKKDIRKRVKKQRPSLKGKALNKEIDRRLKISIGITRKRLPDLVKVDIKQSFKEIKVQGYTTKTGVTVKDYKKTKPKRLTKPQEQLIINNIKKGKSIKEITEIYQRTMDFRTNESIKKHIIRTRKKYNL